VGTVLLPQPLPHQIEFLSSDAKRKILCAGRKFGKAVDVETPIPTPSGWTTMGALEPGDVVFDASGAQTTVTFASEVMHGHECYEVVFTDGSVIVADAGHLWESYTKPVRKSLQRQDVPLSPVTVTTEEMSRSLRYREEANHAVRVCGPIQCPAVDLPLDPYLLGVWLGDGHSAAGMVTKNDAFIFEQIAATGWMVEEQHYPSLKARTWRIVGLTKRLRELGLKGNKHIPAVYFRGSIEQRRGLLAGLMDTNGTCSKLGHAAFDNMDPKLAWGVFELAASLGFKPIMRTKRAKVNGKDCGISWRVQFKPTEQVFRLPRKAERLSPSSSRQNFRCVESISPVASRPVKCIGVASPSHLFLVGRTFIPTHNSTMCLIPAVDGHGAKKQFRGAARGARGTWYVPASYVADEAWDLLKAATKDIWVEKHEQGRRLVLLGGGGITIRSCDNPDMQRGPNNDFVIVDEAALVKDKVWEEVVKPTMAATDGWAIIISTPKGVANWFKKEFDAAPTRPGWARWQRPSSDNPKVSRAFLENERRESTALTFAQEYLAEFVAPGGGLFKRRDARTYWWELNELVWAGGVARESDLVKFLTVDPATSTKTSADHTAILACGYHHSSDMLFLLDLFLERVEGPEAMRQIRSMAAKHDAYPFVEESAVSAHLLSFMREEKISFRTVVPGSRDKWSRAQPAAARWERHSILVPAHADWLAGFERQLYNFEPDGDDDDAVDCLGWAAHVVKEEMGVGAGLPSEGKPAKKLYLPEGVAMRAPPGWG